VAKIKLFSSSSIITIGMEQYMGMFISMGKKMKDSELLGQIIHLQVIITVRVSLDIWGQEYLLL
jgi:hypothetical protein